MNNFLAITYAFMLAYCPHHEISVGEVTESHNEATHVSFQIGLELFDNVYLYAGEETFQVPDKDITNWYPFTQSYWLGAGYRKEFNEKLVLDVGIKRKCEHPINCWQNKQTSDFNKAVVELYLGVEGKVDIF